jgi:transcriptional regulator
MYLPPHFAETRTELLHGLIAAHPLGALVTLGPDGLTADHIPFILDPSAGEHGTLIGHVARANPAWQVIDAQGGYPEEVLVIFQGPTAYISPNWYPTKQITHEVVPTYNYAVVHVHGTPLIHHDPKHLRAFVGRLTKIMEFSQPTPWKMGDSPQAFLNGRLEHIVGIEIPIARIFGKWKTSQNRPAADRTGAASGLRATGDPNAAIMADLIETMDPDHAADPS